MPAIGEVNVGTALVEPPEHLLKEVKLARQIPFADRTRIAHPVSKSEIEQRESWGKESHGFGTHVRRYRCARYRHRGREVDFRIGGLKLHCFDIGGRRTP